jgi:hypothetical protein
MRRTLLSNLTPEDSATHARWVRVVVAFYGCVALLLLLVANTLGGPSPVQPQGSAALADPLDRSSHPVRRAEALLSNEHGGTGRQIHPGKRASARTP